MKIMAINNEQLKLQILHEILFTNQHLKMVQLSDFMTDNSNIDKIST